MRDTRIESDFHRFCEHQDMRALSRVFDGVAPQLFSVARHLAGRRTDAEDLLQATLLTAIERASNWDPARPLLPWLLGVMSMHAHKLRHARGQSIEPERLTSREVVPPSVIAEGQELGLAVASAVARLPRDYADIVRRHLLDGLAPTQLAAQLGLTPVNARVRLHRGLQMLRRDLPKGFAGMGGFAWSGWLGVRSVRARVLGQVAKATGQRAPLSLSPIIAGVLVGAALLLPVLALREKQGDAGEEAVAPLVAMSPAAEGSEASTASTRVEIAIATSQAPAPKLASTPASEARIWGRLIDSEGAPLAGASIEASTSIVQRRLARAMGLDEAALPRSEATTDSDGRFEVRLATHPAVRASLRARAPTRATACFSLGALAAGAAHDLGDVVLAPAARLSIDLRDSAGELLGPHWRIELTEKAEDPAGLRSVYWRRIEPDLEATIEIDDAPAGALEVRATSGILARLPEQRVTLAAGETTKLALDYDGPDPTASIAVDCARSEPSAILSLPPAESFVLIGADCARRVASRAWPHIGYRFDSVPPGAYTIEFEAQGFISATLKTVEPGQTVRLDLLGNAGVQLVWSHSDSPERYDLRATRVVENGMGSSSPLELAKASTVPPPKGLFGGLTPGDWELAYQESGEAARTFQVHSLAAGEMRALVVDTSADARLRGVVRDAGGAPLADVTVLVARARSGSETIRLELPSSGGVQSAAVGYSEGRGVERAVAADLALRTKADGRFEAGGLEPGDWLVAARRNELLRSETIAVKLSETAHEVVLTAPANGRLEGHVLNASSAALARMTLSLFADDNPFSTVDVALQRDGSFRFGPLAVGRYHAELAARPAPGNAPRSSSFEHFGSGTRAASSGVEFEVNAQAVTLVELDAQRIAPGEVRVLLTVDEELVDGCAIEARSTASSPNSVRVRANCGALGLATLTPLPTGVYTLEVFGPNSAWSAVHGEQVTLASGQELELRIAIKRARRTVRFVDTQGKPLTHRRITWRSGSSGYEPSASTRSDGEVVLALPLGPTTFACPGVELAEPTVVWAAGDEVIELRAK